MKKTKRQYVERGVLERTKCRPSFPYVGLSKTVSVSVLVVITGGLRRLDINRIIKKLVASENTTKIIATQLNASIILLLSFVQSDGVSAFGLFSKRLFSLGG
jgi:hypothetical protein